VKIQQSSENENIITIEVETCEVFFNEGLMEEFFEDYFSSQT
jgi:hypothetical protein